VQITNKRRVGRPARTYTIEEIRERVEGLRVELKRLTENYLSDPAMPNRTEKEILRVSRALRREEAK
jgi:hypothetical protein